MSARNGLAANVVPPGGFHYQQVLRDGTTHRIEGSNWEELERLVLGFRLEQISVVDPNRADPASVARDIHDYVCANYPNSCLDRWTQSGVQGVLHGPIPAEDTTFQIFRPLITRIAEWIGDLGNNSKGFVTPAEADARANTCSTCKQNVHWETACGQCVREIRLNTTRILGARKTRHDDKLGGCRKVGWLNKIAVWVDSDKSDDHTLPDCCWHKSK
jgi:hypothetical protein